MRVRIIAAAIAIAISGPAAADPFLQRPVIRLVQPVRIALPDFVAAGPSEIELTKSISQTIASDLEQSSPFELVDQVAFSTKSVDVDLLPEFSDWRKTNTHALVAGRITRQSDGRIKVEFRLWDVSGGIQLTGRQYIGSPDDLRDIGHLIAGDVYQRLTNEKRDFR